MKGEKISSLILVLEIVLIVLLHLNKMNNPNTNTLRIPGTTLAPSNANVMASSLLK